MPATDNSGKLKMMERTSLSNGQDVGTVGPGLGSASELVSF